MNAEPFQTAEGHDYPCCRQLSVFLENRLGQLQRVTRLLEDEPVHIIGLSVDASVDCAILRLLVDDPDMAQQTLSDARFAFAVHEIVVVELPPGKRAIMTLCSVLISAEVNINYVYTVWAGKEKRPCLAIQVDDVATGIQVLRSSKFSVLHEQDL